MDIRHEEFIFASVKLDVWILQEYFRDIHSENTIAYHYWSVHPT